jgi:excisionase family DNA binding protein
MRSSAQREALMSAQELAEYLGVPVATIYRWRYRHEGPRALKIGRHLRYRTIDIERWLDSVAEASDRPSMRRAK